MTKQRSFVLVLVSILMSGCTTEPAGDAKGSAAENVGSIGLELQVASGVAIDTVTFTIHNAALLTSDMTGAIDVAHSQDLEFVVGGLPSGGGYTLALTGTTESSFPCSSVPASFSITASQTTAVSIDLVCTPPAGSAFADAGSLLVGVTVTLADAGPPCPVVTSLTVLPSEVDVGGTMQLSATASSPDATLEWAVTGAAGSLSSTTGPSDVLTCDAAGVATLSVTAIAADPSCQNGASVRVTCDAPALDATVCSTVQDGLGGIGAPAGTTATASADYNSVPDDAIDGLVGTGWNGADYSGWIELAFPAPVAMDGIAINAGSLPTTDEVYTVTGIQGGMSVPLGSWSDSVPTGANLDLPPMLFAAGVYDGIRIDIQGELSWVAINEISLLTMSCPAGPGGAFVNGTGTPIDAGAPTDAAAPMDAAAPEASNGDATEENEENDGVALEAGTCTLGPLPLFGAAQLTGTIRTLGPPSVGPCVSLVSSDTQGSLTFSLTSTGCSFVYIDASGARYSSNLEFAPFFDGDTYEYNVPFGSLPSTLYGPCPELSMHDDGLNAQVTLSVTRSTGIVSLSRLCGWTDSACTGNTFERSGPATDLTLTGALSCSDAAGTTGVLSCGGSTCSTPSQSCCTVTNPFPGPSIGCVETGAQGACSFGALTGCSGPESCPSGFVCCPAPPGAGLLGESTCQATSCPAL